MLYEKYENVTGYQGWVNAVAGHPNVTLNYQKTIDWISVSNRPFRVERVEFLVADKHVAFDRYLYGDQGASHSDPLVAYPEDRLALYGGVSFTTFDPATLADPEDVLVNYDPSIEQMPGDMSLGLHSGIYLAGMDPSAGDKVGLIDDSYTMYAVHVFADAHNLYIIFEVEKGVFLHLFATTDLVGYNQTPEGMLAGGTFFLSQTDRDQRASGPIGWQYAGFRVCPYFLNSATGWHRRSNPSYTYGGPLKDTFDITSTPAILGGAPPATTYLDALYTPSWERTPPGSDLVYYGAYSEFGSALSMPIRWWYRADPNGKVKPFFDLANVRTLHLQGVSALEEFVIDGDTWVAVPDLKLPVSYGGSLSSIFGRFPDESYATPMGVLIRKS